MIYNSKIEQFVDYVQWTKNDPVIWVVYPAGCIGDLVASIINFHYANTGAKYLGINNQGQVIFRDSNQKKINFVYNEFDFKINDRIINFVNEHLSTLNTNYSKIDQIILSNHCWQTTFVNDILDFFTKSKVIRIFPKNPHERNIVKWLSKYKNFNTISKFNNEDSSPIPAHEFTHDRFLNLYFGDILNKNSFDKTYNNIINFLNLDYKLIRYDFIEYYLSKQHSIIRPYLLELANN